MDDFYEFFKNVMPSKLTVEESLHNMQKITDALRNIVGVIDVDIDEKQIRKPVIIIESRGRGRTCKFTYFDDLEEVMQKITDAWDKAIKQKQEEILREIADIDRAVYFDFGPNGSNRYNRRHPNEKFEKYRYKRQRNNSKIFHK